MDTIFGVPLAALLPQIVVGLINGSFYAILSLGLAVIFGMLRIINFAHGVQYMMGAFAAYLLATNCGIGFWWALLLAPIAVASFSVVIERLLLSRLYTLDHLYGLLFTLGLATTLQGLVVYWFGASGKPYAAPSSLSGGLDLGFIYLPTYRAFVIVASLAVCLATWFVIERTRWGSTLRAATENAPLVRVFGINVPRLLSLTYAFGAGLAALAGVMAAPLFQVSPLMGGNIIGVVFAVVVIGGVGSILGAVFTGYLLGVIEGLTKVFYPEAANTIVFLVMVVVLLVRPAGFFGRNV